MPCELTKDHPQDSYCESCCTCFDCLDEEHEATIKKYKDVLKRIIAAHKQSAVDWDAMRDAVVLIGGA